MRKTRGPRSKDPVNSCCSRQPRTPSGERLSDATVPHPSERTACSIRRRQGCRVLAETRQSCPRRTTFQRFAANGVEPDLVGVAFLNNSRHGAKAASAKARSGVLPNGQQGRALWCGVAANRLRNPARSGIARARETEIYGASAERYSPSPHFGATHPRRYPRGVIPWIAACRLVWTRRIGPVPRRVGEVQA